MNIVLDAKCLTLNPATGPFKKQTSVFADWKADTHDTVDRTVQLDCDRWGVRTLVPDQKDLQAIKQLIADHYAELKEVRIGAIA